MSGFEALGVAASVIQVADLGTKLSVKLFSFYRQVKNANLSIQNLSSEIALTSAILRELGETLKTGGSWNLCSKEGFKTLKSVLDQCQSVLGEIQRLVIENKQSGKSGIQQVTEKFRLILLEPKLDPLKQNLERLKSTMLLLLNVIMYAGFVKCKIPSYFFQEQRHLLEVLVQKREEDSVDQSSTQHATTSNSDESSKPFNTMKSEASQSFLESNNDKQSSDLMSSHPELKDYNLLIQKMLREIDCCKHKLENTRHSRIRTGVLNIHSGEIVRFQMQHGSSIPLDYSLFTENGISSLPLKTPPKGDIEDTYALSHSVSIAASTGGESAASSTAGGSSCDAGFSPASPPYSAGNDIEEKMDPRAEQRYEDIRCRPEETSDSNYARHDNPESPRPCRRTGMGSDRFELGQLAQSMAQSMVTDAHSPIAPTGTISPKHWIVDDYVDPSGYDTPRGYPLPSLPYVDDMDDAELAPLSDSTQFDGSNSTRWSQLESCTGSVYGDYSEQTREQQHWDLPKIELGLRRRKRSHQDELSPSTEDSRSSILSNAESSTERKSFQNGNRPSEELVDLILRWTSLKREEILTSRTLGTSSRY